MNIKRGMAIFLGTLFAGLIIPALAFATATGNGADGIFKLNLAIMASVAIAVLATASWVIALWQVRKLAEGRCQNRDCVFNPLHSKAGLAFDYSYIETPEEFTKGAFTAQPEPQPAMQQMLVAQQPAPVVDSPVIEHKKQEYRGAHFRSTALAEQDEGDEPVLWALPPMKHARITGPHTYEKAV